MTEVTSTDEIILWSMTGSQFVAKVCAAPSSLRPLIHDQVTANR
jgi:hypothetical protein